MSALHRIRARLSDVRLAVTCWPGRIAWLRVLGIYAVFAAAGLALGLGSGFLKPGLPPLKPLPTLFLVLALFVRPAFVEEIIFRSLLLPRQASMMGRQKLWLLSAASLAAFVMSHVLNGLLVHRIPVFTDPVFLLLAAAMGAACIVVYLLSQSIWPSVLLHWLTVVTWLLFFGGLGRVQAPLTG